ncbi:MAG: YihY/virulence factor BrkB family protein [Deltaproteobacteria bacterium]|nr:YihY/virulence factor BrkB family protein [Deltaproteobacteria bacterium]
MTPFRTPKPFKHPYRFIRQILSDFRSNQGIVLSGAVAYYVLLSVIPLFTLVLVVSSRFFHDEELLALLRENMNLVLVVPGLTETLLGQVVKFLQHREVIGWVGIVVMLFFSSIAFTVLENTMVIIFYHRVAIKRRHFLVSAILPYIFVLFLGMGLLAITLTAGALQAMEGSSITLFTWMIKLEGITVLIIYLLGVTGLVMLLTAIYMVMPIGKIAASHALLGGVAAAILWEIARHVLIWYFATLSLVNVVYGSLATSIVTLITLEVAGMILLLGAQVIATYERLLEETDVKGPPG